MLEVGQDKSAKIGLNQPLDSVLVQQASEESKAQFSECFSGWMNNEDVLQHRAEAGTESVETDDRPQQDKNDSNKPVYNGNPPNGGNGNGDSAANHLLSNNLGGPNRDMIPNQNAAADSFADRLMDSPPDSPAADSLNGVNGVPRSDNASTQPNNQRPGDTKSLSFQNDGQKQNSFNNPDRPATDTSGMMNHPPDFNDPNRPGSMPPGDFHSPAYMPNPTDLTQGAAQTSNTSTYNNQYPYPPPPNGAPPPCSTYPNC